MTTREQLHRMVDELSDTEAEDALRIMISRREHEVSPRAGTSVHSEATSTEPRTGGLPQA